jgi:hypothetical protein
VTVSIFHSTRFDGPEPYRGDVDALALLLLDDEHAHGQVKTAQPAAIAAKGL